MIINKKKKEKDTKTLTIMGVNWRKLLLLSFLFLFVFNFNLVSSLEDEGDLTINFEYPTPSGLTNVSLESVNSSDFWDNLDTPADISTGDLTDDNTYVEVSGDTMSGNLNLDGNSLLNSLIVEAGIFADDTGGNLFSFNDTAGDEIAFFQDINMQGNDIEDVGNVTADSFFGNGAALTNIPTYNATYLSTYNETYLSTYNATYDLWAYNQTIAGGGSVSPSGIEGSIQFNSGGDFDGNEHLIWDNSSKFLEVNGSVYAMGGTEDASDNLWQLYVYHPAATGYDTEKLGFTIGTGSGSSHGEGAIWIRDANGNQAELLSLSAKSGGAVTFSASSFLLPKTTSMVYQDGPSVISFQLSSRSANSELMVGPQYATEVYTYGLVNLFTSDQNSSGGIKHYKIKVKDLDVSSSWREIFIMNGSSPYNAYFPRDEQKVYFGEGHDSYITYDGTNMIFNSSASGSGLAYFSDNVSATGFVTRTSVYDKDEGSALDQIKDADSLVKLDGEISHKDFYGYVKFNVTDFSKPEIRRVCDNETFSPEENKCWDETYYPHEKIEEGVDLGKEIDVLRQAVYELKIRNEELEARISALELTSK